MKQFFKFLFASCLGVFLAIFVLFGIGSWMVGKSISSATAVKKTKANSVLHLTLEDAIPQKTNNIERSLGAGFDTDDVVGLTDMVEAIEAAKTDDNIKGIFFGFEFFHVGPNYSRRN